jgi:CPA1 family monovalent cation:H+ antiporter
VSLPSWLLLLSGLLAGAVLVGLLARRLRLPLTVLLALAGFAAAVLGRSQGVVNPLQGEAFEEVLVFLFLPVLVFAASLGLSVRAFLRDLPAILALSVVALVVSAALVGVALDLGLGLALPVALLFGALISATDPVAVVAVFQELGVPRRLLTLVEGESLLNDGVAIVAYEILLAAALGGTVSVIGGVGDFLLVFAGGTALGMVLGLVAAAVLPWLPPLPGAALSLAVAYGSFVLADHVFGFSGVMATVAAGLVLGALAPSRASAEVRQTWETLWESLDYVANAVLFLLIGLAIDPALVAGNLGAIALAVVVVLVARALAVLPLVAALERFAGITRVGLRNEAVLIWGGLRGGVALALALALPEDLAGRELLVAMTGGVVLATLLVNATTIGWLVRRLGLDRPSRPDSFLAAAARAAALRRARGRLGELGVDDRVVVARLEGAEQEAWEELEGLELSHDEQRQAVTRQGLSVERDTYQRLSDQEVLPPTVARLLEHEVDDQIDEVHLGRPGVTEGRRGVLPRVDRLVAAVVARLPQPAGEDPETLDYAEATARRLAARRSAGSLDLLRRLPGLDHDVLDGAIAAFRGYEEDAIASLRRLDEDGDDEGRLRRDQAEALSRAVSTEALEELADAGLLPMTVREAAGEIIGEVR